MASSPRPAPTRLRFLDASRGLTMFFVLLSHFAAVYFSAPEQEAWRAALVRIGMIATPTFVILSGMVLGIQYHAAHANFDRVRASYIDRGLFLLFVGHLVISFALQRVEHGVFQLYSTDVIGVAMILGGFLVPTLGTKSRLGVSAAIYVGSWLAIYGWHPHAASGMAATKELLVGSLTPTALRGGSFPIAPWFAVYLASSVLGERLAGLTRSGAMRQSWNEFVLFGTGGIAGMVAVKLVALRLGLSPLTGNVTSALLRVGQKSPPAPLYLLFYGGIGLLLMCGCLVAEKRQWCRRAFRCVTTCGEASLFVFLAHFYLFWIGLYRLGPGRPALGFVYFTCSTIVLVAAAHVWQRNALNRVFTVRYRTAQERMQQSLSGFRLDVVPAMWVERPAKN